jgi:formylmethanofuran dehydrogenase subunit A
MTTLKVTCKDCAEGVQSKRIAVDDYKEYECPCCGGDYENCQTCTTDIEIGYDYDNMGYATMDEAMQALYNDYNHLNLDNAKDKIEFNALCQTLISISYY